MVIDSEKTPANIMAELFVKDILNIIKTIEIKEKQSSIGELKASAAVSRFKQR